MEDALCEWCANHPKELKNKKAINVGMLGPSLQDKVLDAVDYICCAGRVYNLEAVVIGFFDLGITMENLEGIHVALQTQLQVKRKEAYGEILHDPRVIMDSDDAFFQ
ncbi:hypothetical protein M422DRAFT_264789 [Sphaerobolus stellatus SS14]|uniref:Uncharacterized protein n=1 Tax=Sphaerobolus stellatus (strain SS14) TaxID=990650 RepID=A0A0C9TSI8_SPHS4|nr:hypothetical protein M422DRAFT_264789 [Sphaerobolus stellatus SS14]